jgi:hypothetical protein
MAVTTSVESNSKLWDAYNLLLLGPDLGRIRKMLARYRLFEQALHVPGDVVECGVFKGAGLMYWAKLIEIFAPNSGKRVIGFDAFRPFSELELREEEHAVAERHDKLVPGIRLQELTSLVEDARLTARVRLIGGQIEKTAGEYARKQVGSRIALLHLDLDTYSGTKAALTSLYPLVSRGGIVILDEYGIAGMGETDAVDEFFAGSESKPIAVPHSESPTAYLVKP